MAVIDLPSAVRAPIAGTTTRRYAAFGHTIDSQIELPVAECAFDAAPPGWSIVWADETQTAPPRGELLTETVCDDACHNGQAISRAYRGPSGTWVWSRDSGWYHISPDARRVTVYPDPGADERAISLVLIGHVAIFVLHQLGLPSLHASAVVLGGQAVAFVGPPGAGKSTMAGCFLRQGTTLLSDDVLPLQTRADGIYGMPGAPFMKVWPGTARETLGINSDLPDLTATLSKKLLRLEGRYTFAAAGAPLRAVYFLRRYDPQLAGERQVSTSALSQRDAFQLLMNQSPRCEMLYPREAAALLPLYARLLNQARVRLLLVPNGFEHHDMVRQHILADLESVS